jgi:hypothetical protein
MHVVGEDSIWHMMEICVRMGCGVMFWMESKIVTIGVCKVGFLYRKVS